VAPSMAILCAALALAASACGGGNDARGTTGGSETLSASEFRQRADAVCLKFYEQIDALGQPSSPDEFLDYSEEALPLIAEGHRELRELVPPADLAATWNKALSVNAEVEELVRQLRDAVREGDLGHAEELVAQIRSTDDESGRLARQVGLKECG
jgi:hypothetical protein